AGAVLAQQRVHLAGLDRQIHASQRLGRAKALADAAHLQARRRGHSFNHFLKSGFSSACAAGAFMLSRVISVAPVSMRFSTGWFLRCSTIALTPRSPILI